MPLLFKALGEAVKIVRASIKEEASGVGGDAAESSSSSGLYPPKTSSALHSTILNPDQNEGNKEAFNATYSFGGAHGLD